MRSRLFIALTTAVLLVAAKAFSQTNLSTEPASDPAVAVSVDDLVKKLASADFRTRKVANNAALDLPPEAIPFLQQALDSTTSAEVRQRLKKILPFLKARRRAALLDRQLTNLSEAERRDAIAAITAPGRSSSAPSTAGFAEAVTAALDVYPFAQKDSVSSRQKAQANALFDKAIALGGDDPLLSYLALRHKISDGAVSFDDSDDQLFDTVQQVLAGKYPPTLQLDAAEYCLDQFGQSNPDLSRHDERQLMATAQALLRQVTSDKQFPSITYRAFGSELMKLESVPQLSPTGESPQTNQDFVALVKQLQTDAPLPEDADVMEAVGWFLRAKRCRQRAEQFHNAGPLADSYKSASADEFSRSVKLLDHAISADPDDPQPPTIMLTITVLTQGSKDDVEKWYRSAMTADPENRPAADAMLAYLESNSEDDPKGQALLEFGRGCVATGAWKAQLPLVLVNAHLFIAHYNRVGAHNDHLSDPAAWAEVKDVCETYLSYYPDHARFRSFYASIAAHTHHWKEASEQLAILGDQADYAEFNGEAEYKYLVRKMHHAQAAGVYP